MLVYLEGYCTAYLSVLLYRPHSFLYLSLRIISSVRSASLSSSMSVLAVVLPVHVVGASDRTPQLYQR